MKAPDMAKENNFLLREAAKAAQMGYYDHLAAGGKGDPAEERWIEALTAGADAITQVAVLETRLAQVERERDALKRDLCTSCPTCKHWAKHSCTIGRAIPYECELCDEYEWRGVCEENTKETST